MKKLSIEKIEKKVFTTKQAVAIVLVVVAVIAFIGSSSPKDFFLKVLAYGVTSALVVILSANFLSNDPKDDNDKKNV